MDRRQVIFGGLAALTALGARAREPVFIGDMHFHLFFTGKSGAPPRPLRAAMEDGGATLVSWSLVGDLPWLRAASGGFKQKGDPKRGEAAKWFREELGRVTAHIAGQKLKIARSPDDVARAVKGDPHVVLSVEGASFLDEDIGQLETAYDAGVRHIQLVHFITNGVGDFQTGPPRAGGLTEFGKKVVAECNRLGMLIDLAHSTEEAVTQALAISRAPVVWSHSSVTEASKPDWTMTAWRARQITVASAKAIAEKGGVVGLWGLRADVGGSIEGYGDRLLSMADLIGEDHAAFGTDMNAVANPVIKGYADLRRVIGHWEGRGVETAKIHKLAIGNYARALSRAMDARRA